MPATRLITEVRHTPILQYPSLPCKGDLQDAAAQPLPTINITRGCLHSCVYCYARGFRGAPPKGEICLYDNLPAMLAGELDRKRKPPKWVSFSTASDPFQNLDEILKTVYSVMRLLLERRIGISFLTKAAVPSEFISLFGKHPGLVRASIGIASLDEDYQKLFEPFASKPEERLMTLRRLSQAKVETSARIDPILPDVSDSSGAFERLAGSLAQAGVSSLSASALLLRPSIARQFLAELPPALATQILAHYRGQPYQRVMSSHSSKLLPKPLRLGQYARLRAAAHRHGLSCSLCGCKNPDLPWECCDIWPTPTSTPTSQDTQPRLFDALPPRRRRPAMD